MHQRKEDKKPGTALSRRTMLKLTGGALAGTLLGCSDAPSPQPESDGPAAPTPDAGGDAAPPAADVHVAADSQPDTATTEPHAGPIFFVHFSDIHIGGGPLALPALQFGLGLLPTAFPAIPVFATGDLVESGIDTDDWAGYQGAIDQAGLNADDFIEIPGNHDALLNTSLSNYLTHTLAGRAGHGLYGLYHRVHQGRRIRIVALNTASSRNVIKDSTGYLQPAQVDELIEQIDADPTPVHATIVLGHHPTSTPFGLGLHGTDAHLERLLAHTSAAAYLHGHVHMHLKNWEGKTLMAQAPSLGNPSDSIPGAGVPGFNIFALDDGPVAKPLYHNGDPQDIVAEWPLVMITRPANVELGKEALSSATNPWAVPLPRTSSGNLLHAGVFAPDPNLGARFRIDAQPWQEMTRVRDHFAAEFDTPDKDSCVIEVQGQTSGGAVGSDSITIRLA